MSICIGATAKKENILKCIKAVTIDKAMCVVHSEQAELNHGYRQSWYFSPSGALHVTFDAMGALDELCADGLQTTTDIHGTLIVVGITAINGA